uniref:PD-(D/E)XK endonuclease-like domain-containing protein n=1 Tax=uncultured marine group II/III euryarchaeote KM3_74_A11 TaxID=1456500 RepID=A0A075HM60_9EURY|nr:hypothetical protein [uncultured marine group II/III euryarchaeote KM3_74_A11]
MTISWWRSMGPNQFSGMLTCPRRVTLWIYGDQDRGIRARSSRRGDTVIDADNINIMKGNLMHDSIQGLFIEGIFSEEQYEHAYAVMKYASDEKMWTDEMIDLLEPEHRTMESGKWIHKDDVKAVYKALKKFRKYLYSNGLEKYIWTSEYRIEGTITSGVWGEIHLRGDVDLRGEDSEGNIILLELKSPHEWKEQWRTQIELYGLMQPDSVEQLIVWSPRRKSSCSLEEGVEHVNPVLNPEERYETNPTKWICEKCPDTLCRDRSPWC